MILLAAVALSIALGDWVEAAVILAIVLLNAVVGAFQEARAERALELLRELSAPDARIVRDGRQLAVAAREIVPGDIVLLDAGAIVPADVRLVESTHLRIDESSLTGESVPSRKRADVVLDPDAPIGDRVNCAYAGTIVTYGRGLGIVTATGIDTQLGEIAAEIAATVDEPTPLQRRLDAFGKTMGAAVLGVCAAAAWSGALAVTMALAVCLLLLRVERRPVDAGGYVLVASAGLLAFKWYVLLPAIILIWVMSLGTTVVFSVQEKARIAEKLAAVLNRLRRRSV